MSTVVALGHFCEVHGPRLVFYTIRNVNEPQFVSQCPDLKFCSGCKAPLLEGYISTVQTVQSNSPSDEPSCSPPTNSPQVSNSHSAPSGLSKLKSSSSTHRLSIASTSFTGNFTSRGTSTEANLPPPPPPDKAPPTTEPSAATKYYCSHSNYDHSHLNHLQTCISRTLSCELSPSNSVAFTSSEIWVIGTAFSLKDSQARGFHRRYCLIFTFLPEIPMCCHPDALPEVEYKKSGKKQKHRPNGTRPDIYSDGDYKAAGGFYAGGYPSLVPFYDYITEEFYNIAKNLQTECDKVYFKEQSVSPQRVLRLSAFLDGTVPGSELSAGGSSSLGGHGRSSRVLSRSHTTGARSLPLLTANPHVFLDLHEKFAKILHHVDL